MKTLEQIKDEIAIAATYKDWKVAVGYALCVNKFYRKKD